MLLLKSMVVILSSVFLLLGVCEDSGDDPSEQQDEQRALELAAVHAGDRVSDIPYTGDYYDCIIFVALQPEPPASPLRNVNGRCIWTVEPEGSTSWVVTFRETWLCSDWAADAEGYPPCNELTGFHEWKYFVEFADNGVNLLDDSGQFAPDMG